MRCRQLNSKPTFLVYSIWFLRGYNHCIAPPDPALRGSAESGYITLVHTLVQTHLRMIPVVSAGSQGKVKFSCFGHPT